MGALLDPVVKDEWLEALRSGLYSQGKFRLQLDGKYCCLGILCLVMDEDAWFDRGDGGADGWGWGGYDDSQNLDPDIMSYNVQRTLQRMNDDEDKTFPEIADYIERYL